jgi:uncharacterized protein
MKALLLLAVIFAGVWLWRSRQVGLNRPVAPPPAPPKALDMVQCAQCGLHVAVVESVLGKQGSYCSQAHLKQSEG